MLVILPKSIICDTECTGTATDSLTVSSKHWIIPCCAVPRYNETLIIPRMTEIADFEQRWWQRGKTVDCSFKLL